MSRMLASALAMLVGPAALAATVVLTEAMIVDPAAATHAKGMTVVIEGERIAAVFADGSRPIPEESVVHDLDGAFVIPGLIEAHTHLTPTLRRSREAMHRELARMLYGGIVAAREMAGNVPMVREALPADGRAPDLFQAGVTGGPWFMQNDRRNASASEGHARGRAPWSPALSRETDFRAAIAGIRESGAHAVKLYAMLDAEVVRLATAEAHRQGLRVWAHATTYPAEPMEVVTAGVDAVSHLCSLGWADPDADATRFERVRIEERPSFDPALVDVDGPEIGAVLEEMARRGTILDATLANHLRPGDDAHGCTAELVTAIAKRAHAAGVRFVTGTDFMAPEESPWPSLHLEIEALVREGVLTPAEALAAATLNGAAVLGREDDYGAVAPGRLASLVVLARDPLEDVGALKSIVSVVKRGVLYPRAELGPGLR